jgi:hypothetical protein
LFRYSKGIINLDAQVSDRAFNLGVTKQNLNSSQVARAPVDHARFGSSQRVRAEQMRI